MTNAFASSPVPEFPDSVAHRSSACSPRELFCALHVDPEDSVHFLEPAFRFVDHALDQAERWGLGDARSTARRAPSEALNDAPSSVDTLLASGALSPLRELPLHDASALADALIDWAHASLPPAPEQPFATSWPARVCREFAPVGLADGAWLRGTVLANRVETPLGMEIGRAHV